MKKLNDLSTCEIIALTNAISQKIFNCFDKKELIVIKSILSNIIQQLYLYETVEKQNNDNSKK